jgi:hypothetical protein
MRIKSAAINLRNAKKKAKGGNERRESWCRVAVSALVIAAYWQGTWGGG